nr:hypothetical protein [Tanacetum cinerariifolium]
MALLLVEERFLKIKQALEKEQNQPKNIQELLLKLINDFQILNGIQLKQKEQATKVSSQYWNPHIFYDDDDEESSITLKDIISELPLSVAITPDLPITDFLIMEDEHLNTIPNTTSDKENESSVKDLNPTPSESEDLSDNESECDVPIYDDSFPNFMTFSNPLFDSNDDFTYSDDESFSEDIDSLLEEFSGELTHINLIPSGIDEADFDPEEDILLVKKLLYDNSSPRPLEELNFKISDAIIESFSPSPILVEDSDYLIEEIDASDCRPIRIEEAASWDLDKRTWGGQVRSFGTVPVRWGAQEWLGNRARIVPRVLKFGQIELHCEIIC